MSFRDDLRTILAGGLPALLDDPASGGPVQPASNAEGSPVQPQRVEEVAPDGTFRDREPFLMRVTQTQILVGTAAVVGALALLMIARR